MHLVLGVSQYRKARDGVGGTVIFIFVEVVCFFFLLEGVSVTENVEVCPRVVLVLEHIITKDLRAAGDRVDL